MSPPTENRRPLAETATREPEHGDQAEAIVSVAEHRILVRRRNEARRAGWEFGVLFGVEDLLQACTDPYTEDDLPIDWHAAGMDLGVPAREFAGIDLLGAH